MIIVGLGNPGDKYANTKHNIGYWVVDKLANQLSLKFKLGKGEYMHTQGSKISLLKPLNYMNNSGLALKSYVDYFDINIDDILVVYDDADLVCNSLGAKLATHEQVVDAYKTGAEWCNYGWTKGQNALFPIQKDTWERIQSGPADTRDDCGQNYGVNGGFFENTNLRFGVNCYGKKPEGDIDSNYRISEYETRRAREREGRLKELQEKQLSLLPFNEGQWSEYGY